MFHIWNVWQFKKTKAQNEFTIIYKLQRQSIWLNLCIPLVKEKIKRHLGNSCFEKNVAWLLYWVCKVIWYVVLTMHKLKLRLSYLKELYVRSEILIWKLPLMKEKSAAMPFGSEALLSQFFITLNTGSNILTWHEGTRRICSLLWKSTSLSTM